MLALFQTLVCGARKMVVVDDLEPSEKLKVFDCGYDEIGGEARFSTAVRRRVGDVCYEARLVNPELGHHKGYPLAPHEWVEGL